MWRMEDDDESVDFTSVLLDLCSDEELQQESSTNLQPDLQDQRCPGS